MDTEENKGKEGNAIELGNQARDHQNHEVDLGAAGGVGVLGFLGAGLAVGSAGFC